MIDELLASYGHTLDLIERTVRDVPEAHWATQPENVPNHALWTLGHLTHSAQAIGGELGLAPWLPADFEGTYGTGSTPHADRSRYPALPELMEGLRAGARRLEQRLGILRTEVLHGPLPDARYRSVFPSLAHATLHILAAHTAFHGGQLMVWRRALGLPTEGAL